MFGYGIKFYRKSKGLKVDPVVEPAKESDEFKKWKDEQERIKTREIGHHNRSLMAAAIQEKVNEYKARFEKEVPRPFEVGELVTYRYYDPTNNPFSLGWHASPGTLAKTFDAPNLAGPITFPVHTIRVDGSMLYDKLDSMCGYHCNFKINEVVARNIVHEAFGRLLFNYKKPYLAEWVIDFDWKTLKVPVGNCANEEGWLDLRWGGFNAGYFRSANTPMAKMQIDLWAKEKAFREAEKKYKKELEEMRANFEAEKAKLF